VTGYWSQMGNQAFLLKLADSLQVNTTAGPIAPGNVYFFYWHIDVPGCPPSVSETVVRNLSAKPSLGPDVNWCSPDASYPLKAPFLLNTGQYGESSRWYSPDASLQFTSPTAINTVVSKLKPGKNIIIWELNDGYCGDKSRDTLIIDYGVAPVLENDAYTVPYGTPVTINVLLNDALPLTRKVFILNNPLHGTIDTLSEGVYKYQPTGTFSGQDIAYYRVCNFVCPDTTCATASITFTVEEKRGCAIPTLITPNGDDLNDQFVVRCQVGEAPTLSVTVFNQWGDEVFHQEPYENKWEGTNSGGEDLPVGTYYVIIDFKDGTKPYAGFLLIQR
ncbi:MAG TPA: gliding motility-associated C-terminal domain-containing protein, partial [Saprospiraceae bacterium]|nr:gliding motility-associated C-terminal domain-containing protein [Saprospiraceae bacterium]